jgi:hypothetical protein
MELGLLAELARLRSAKSKKKYSERFSNGGRDRFSDRNLYIIFSIEAMGYMIGLSANL